MIKPGNLRLNNLLKIGNDIATVKGVSYDNFIQYTISGKKIIRVYGEPVEEFEPIPLTEQWLKDFGFVPKMRSDTPRHNTPVWACYSFSLTIWDDGRLFYDWMGGNIEVKYIHHLQNIFNDLLGKELTKKL